MKRLRLRGSDRLGDVLGRDDGALNDQDVELGGQAGRRQRLGALRGDRRRRRDARLLHLADARRDQLGLDRLAVHLLHAGRGLLVVELADLVEEVGRVLVAGPQALEVQDAQAAELAQLDGRRRADHPVHGRAEQRQLEAVGVDLPGDVDVLGVPGAAAGHDGDVVEPVGLPPGLVNADLDLSHVFALRHSMGPVRLTVHTGMSIANAGPTRRRSTTLLSPRRRSGHISGRFRPMPAPRSHAARLRPSVRRQAGRARSTTCSSSWIMRAVAPQISSPSTSKNHTGKEPSGLAGDRAPRKAPALLVEVLGVGQVAQRARRRPARPRPGWPPRAGGRGRWPPSA